LPAWLHPNSLKSARSQGIRPSRMDTQTPEQEGSKRRSQCARRQRALLRKGLSMLGEGGSTFRTRAHARIRAATTFSEIFENQYWYSELLIWLVSQRPKILGHLAVLWADLPRCGACEVVPRCTEKGREPGHVGGRGAASPSPPHGKTRLFNSPGEGSGKPELM
jgi:hypothetical protein